MSTGTEAQQAKFRTPDFGKLLMITVANTTFDSWKGKVTAAQAGTGRTYLGRDRRSGARQRRRMSNTPRSKLVLRAYVLDAANGKFDFHDIATLPGSTTANVQVNTDAGA